MELDEKPLISVIVPVYNVEPYLRKCLDSILNQTYRNLEIIIVDDGSTDDSGKICDEYHDSRIQVFHTENRGLSAARNLGLDHAAGQYIGFVDSDDWIEPDMYEVLLNKALETGADVVECGVYITSQNKTEEKKRRNSILSGADAVGELLQDKLADNAWNKLYIKQCFLTIRFPEGMIFEDIATTYKVFAAANLVAIVDAVEYHYIRRRGSLSRVHNGKNLLDFWRVHKNRYDELKDRVDKDGKKELLKYCASAAARTWAYYLGCSQYEKRTMYLSIREMNRFINNHVPLFGYRYWKLKIRIGTFFPHYRNTISFVMAYCMNKMCLKGYKERL